MAERRPICPAVVPDRAERPPVVGIAMVIFVFGGILGGIILAVMVVLSEIMFLLETMP